MNQLELIKLIEERKRKLENERDYENPEVKFCQEYQERYPTRELEHITEMDLCDLFIAIYRSHNIAISFEELHDFVSKNKQLIRTVNDRDTIIKLFSELDMLMDTGEFEKIQEYQKQDCIVESLSELATTEYFASLIFKTVVETITDLGDDYDLYSLMEMYKQDGLEIFKVKAAVSSISELKEAIEDYEYTLSVTEHRTNKTIDKKTSDKIKRGYLEKFFDIQAINAYISDALKYTERVLSNEKKRKRTITKELSIYDNLEGILCSISEKDEITEIDKLLEKLSDESIRAGVLRYIYEHNDKIYSNLQTEYNQLSASSSSHYKVLLTNYGISSDQYDVSTIMDKSLDELTQMLEKLNKMGITGPKLLLRIIQNGNLEVTTYIESLLEKNIISKEFIITNFNVFATGSDELSALRTNIEFLREKGLNVHYLRASQEMFLLEPQQLEASIKVLEDYDLTNSMKTGMKCDFLQYEDLKEVIDVLLELGYEKNLEEKLELLNYKDKFERLRLLKELNIPITTVEELIDVVSSDKFMMPDGEISSYIYNAVDYMKPQVKIATVHDIDGTVLDQLEKFSETKRTYSFDGILISKNKVKRNISNLSAETNKEDRIIYSIVNGSILSDEEFGTVDNLIRQTSSKVIQKTQVNE